MPKGNWVMMPKGVLNPGDTISVTRTNPHSNTPDTEKATRNLAMSLKGYRREIISIGEKACFVVVLCHLAKIFQPGKTFTIKKKLAFH